MAAVQAGAGGCKMESVVCVKSRQSISRPSAAATVTVAKTLLDYGQPSDAHMPSNGLAESWHYPYRTEHCSCGTCTYHKP